MLTHRQQCPYGRVKFAKLIQKFVGGDQVGTPQGIQPEPNMEVWPSGSLAYFRAPEVPQRCLSDIVENLGSVAERLIGVLPGTRGAAGSFELCW
jgi:hypothetical protein